MGSKVKALMPPQGILVAIAYYFREWDIRFIDENLSPKATKKDYQRADVVVSGMNIQRQQINEINRLAHQEGKITVLGGSSVLACAEYYPDFDILNTGELGDGTDRTIAYLDRNQQRPQQQIPFHTSDRILESIGRSQIPILTINLLYEIKESNVKFLMPYEKVLQIWQKCILTAYEPKFLYDRFNYNFEHTYPNRIKPPLSRARVNPQKIRKGFNTIGNIAWRVGILGKYRQTFWKIVFAKLRIGDIESLVNIIVVSHHLIEFASECKKGEESASFYSQKLPQENYNHE